MNFASVVICYFVFDRRLLCAGDGRKIINMRWSWTFPAYSVHSCI